VDSLERLLDDGRVLVVYPLLHGMGRIGIGWPDTAGFDDVW
jgi:hypothetical protein